MRTILALVLLGLAGYLIWHGFSTAAPAKTELDLQKAKIGGQVDFGTLQQKYPYSDPAIDAREIMLESQIQAREKAATPKIPGKDDLKAFALEIPDRTKKGISSEQPYVQPDAAAIVGVAGLLIALLLPGTRFRGLAFLGLLLGAGAALAGMLPADSQVGLVQKFGPLKYVITSFPRVAQACLALAGITLGIRVRSAPRPSS